MLTFMIFVVAFVLLQLFLDEIVDNLDQVGSEYEQLPGLNIFPM